MMQSGQREERVRFDITDTSHQGIFPILRRRVEFVQCAACQRTPCEVQTVERRLVASVQGFKCVFRYSFKKLRIV